LIIGGKTSISLFGGPTEDSYSYKKPSKSYGTSSDTYQTSSQSYGYSAPKAYPETKEYAKPYAPSQSSSYPAYAPSAYSKGVTTFGSSKQMRTENNLGGDGEERFSVKVHHPPGGGSSLNLFGGPSEPSYKAPAYKPTAYKAPVYEEPVYETPTYASKAAPYSYDKGYSDENEEPPAYYPKPSGFTSSSAYSKPKYVEPSSLGVSYAPTKAFGQRVESGMNCGPTTEKTSVRVHAPPGGKSSIFF